MKIFPILKNDLFPFLVIDDFYSEDQLNLIWKELDFLYDKIKPEYEIVAKRNGEPIASVKRIYLDSLYNHRETSNILSIFPQSLYRKEIVDMYVKSVPSGINFATSNSDSTQLGYYEHKDGYKAHTDTTQHTVLTWLFKKPKKFEGGDLIFTQSKIKVDCFYNRTVIFPSWYYHAVSEINMKEEDKDKGLGRWAITHFINFKSIAVHK
tara:strand:- start:2876 stop:3499 length:624 start_codon:yes stop_codon:yes gene_type:complete